MFGEICSKLEFRERENTIHRAVTFNLVNNLTTTVNRTIVHDWKIDRASRETIARSSEQSTQLNATSRINSKYRKNYALATKLLQVLPSWQLS